MAQQIGHAASEKKAQEITILDVDGTASYCGAFVLCNGSNRRQVRAIAEYLLEELKKEQGLTPIGVEGLDSCKWVLLDYGDVLVHVFEEPMRGYYDLDGLWIDAPRYSYQGQSFEPAALVRAPAS